jgi:hypothetical protein
MRGLAGPLLLLAALAASPAGAQGGAPSVATSPAPDRVAVTVYRAPDRGPGDEMELEWLEGYALISETRTVAIPAGESEIRFEGVAGGIIPQSAIVTGLPDGVVEKNHDAYLLSPASLLDRSLGRRVHVRRTSRATGEVVEEEAVIRSGAGGAVVLQTAAGFESLRCTGLSETLVYPEVPAGLAARPTLSVRARSSRAVTATVTLSYLATGFDWQANYVVTLSADGASAAMFAWLTLASSDETSFADAETQAVAGRLNREEDDDDDDRGAPSPELNLTCWPWSRTSDIPLEQPAPPPPSAPMMAQDESFQLSGEESEGANITVTGSRVMARQEELGDLKLYRLPERVTVASNSQKQVALLDRPDVRIRTVYRSRSYAADAGEAIPARRVLLTRNRTAEGLGLPLPAGRVVLFAAGRDRPLLIGEGFVRDRAIGEEVEIELDEAPGILARIEEPVDEDDDSREGEWDDYVLTVSNDRAYPVAYEVELMVNEGQRLRPERRLGRRNGRPLWSVTVPANGEASLRYRVREVEVADDADDEDAD